MSAISSAAAMPPVRRANQNRNGLAHIGGGRGSLKGTAPTRWTGTRVSHSALAHSRPFAHVTATAPSIRAHVGAPSTRAGSRRRAGRSAARVDCFRVSMAGLGNDQRMRTRWPTVAEQGSQIGVDA